MPTLEQVRQQIRAIGPSVDLFGTRKEVKHLPDVLQEGETIRHLTSGIMDNSTWLIVCTDRRVLLLDKGLLYGLKQKEILLKSISSVEYSTGLLFGEIALTVSHNRLKISNCAKTTVRPFVEELNRAREQAEAPVRKHEPVGATSADDVVSKLERLASLRERGLLTDEEFAEQKQRMLASL